MKSAMNLQDRCSYQHRLLNDSQIARIHAASLQILEKVGTRILNEEAIELLEKAGCRIGDKNIVKIPGDLVEECIQRAPRKVTVYDRQRQPKLHLEGRNTYFGTGTDLLYTYDISSGRLRPSVYQDIVNAAIAFNALEHIDFLASYGSAGDCPTDLVYIYNFKALLENSVKPIFFTAGSKEDLSCMISMAAAAVGGEKELKETPFIIHYAEPISPLTHSREAVDKLLMCADFGIPVTYTPAMLSGSTGPVTLAGAIALANAEALSGLVMHQLRVQGAPLISGIAVTTMDMRTTSVTYAAPELRVTHSAYADLYHHYGIPMWGTAGCSDSNCVDEQAALELGISLLMAAQDGTNLIHDVGYLGHGLIGALEMLVMTDEVINMVKRILRGFEISEETLALDLIQSVGPGGHFIREEHTLKHFRTEHWAPAYLNRDYLLNWEQKGKPTYREKLKKKVLEILENPKIEPLSQEIAKEIDRIVQSVTKD